MKLKLRILQKHRKLITACVKLRKLADLMIAANPKIETLKSGIACYVMAKTYKTYGVIIQIAKLGYSEDAEMLARTLFDAYIVMFATLDDSTDKTAEKYAKFDDETRTKMYSRLKSNPKIAAILKERSVNPKSGDESVETIEKRALEWQSEYGKEFRQKWHSGKTTGQMADLAEIKGYFETAYELQSQLVHTLFRPADRYVVDINGELRMKVEPDENQVDMCLVSAFNMFIFVVNKFNKHFSLGHEAEIEKLSIEYQAAVLGDGKNE